jgi:hypothetical protein
MSYLLVLLLSAVAVLYALYNYYLIEKQGREDDSRHQETRKEIQKLVEVLGFENDNGSIVPASKLSVREEIDSMLENKQVNFSLPKRIYKLMMDKATGDKNLIDDDLIQIPIRLYLTDNWVGINNSPNCFPEQDKIVLGYHGHQKNLVFMFMRRIGEWYKCGYKKDLSDLNAIEPIDPPLYWKYVDLPDVDILEQLK